MNYLVLDLEVENHPHISGHIATPRVPENYIVSFAAQDSTGAVTTGYYTSKEDAAARLDAELRPLLVDCAYIVAHNAAFEYLWLTTVPTIQEWILAGGYFMDTMYIEYSLRGYAQAAHMPSLNALSEQYGGTVKNDQISVLWEGGMRTSEIDKGMLLEYNVEDTANTARIYKAQLSLIKREPLAFKHQLHTRMRGCMALYEMEANGIHVDAKLGAILAESAWKEVDEIYAVLREDLPESVAEVFNPQSFRHISSYVYGGPVGHVEDTARVGKDGKTMFAKLKFTAPVVDGCAVEVYGSGKRAGAVRMREYSIPTGTALTKKEVQYTYLPQRVDPKVVHDLPASSMLHPDGKTAVYSTAKEIMQGLYATQPSLKLLGGYNELARSAVQYLVSRDGTKGLLTKVDPATGILYYNILTCNTLTGRMSTTPAVQNAGRIEPSKLRAGKMNGAARTTWTSRYTGGSIVEGDYSSLEDRALAAASQDKAFMRDVNAGLDRHSLLLSLRGVTLSASEYAEFIELAPGDVVEPPVEPLVEPRTHPRRLTYEEVKQAVHMPTPWGKRLKSERQGIKAATFADAYECGIPVFAANLGVSQAQAKAVRKSKDDRYPGIALLKQTTGRQIAVNNKGGYGFYYDILGTKYHFVLERPKYSGKYGGTNSGKHGVKGPADPSAEARPQLIANKPIQGMGAAIMQIMLAVLYREFLKRGWVSWNKQAKAVLVLTIHDSVVADCQADTVEQASAVILDTMQGVTTDIVRLMHVDLHTDFPVETLSGSHLP